MNISLKQKISLKVIFLAKKLAGNSFINELALTGRLKGLVYRASFKESSATINYLGATFKVPLQDTGIAPALVGGYYEKNELLLFKMISAKSKTVLDIGGNIGLFAVLGAMSLTKGSKLYSFEPIKANIEYLRVNVEKNKVGNKCIVIPDAVGSANGNIKIFISKNNIGGHSVSNEIAGSNIHETVKAVTVDKFVNENKLTGVDLIKIDVEGHDIEVLTGAKKVIKKFKPTIFIELVPHLLKKSRGSLSVIEDMFDTYDNVYLISENKKALIPLDKSFLSSKFENLHNSNLIFSANAEHNKTLNSF